MTHLRFVPGAVLLVLLGSSKAESIYKDWAVACDNTHHCEAVGYQEESSGSAPVLLHLQRDAGPATPVRATFMVETDDEADAGALTLRIGKFVLRGIRSDRALPPEQTRNLLPQLLNASAAELTNGKTVWRLSLAGVKAALLKMDDLQGRIGTPGALVQKGTNPEASVPAARPLPVLQPAPVSPPRKGDDKLAAPILHAIQERECWDDMPDSAQPRAVVTRLSSTQLLVMRECGRGAYQSGYAAWIANDKSPYRPRQVLFPEASNTTTDYVMNADFQDGVMTSFGKGRGIGDCGDSMRWIWTAAGFKLLDAAIAPLCRGFPGGGVKLPQWRAQTSSSH